MRYWLIAIAALVLVAMTQSYMLPYFRIAGVRFDLMMVVLIAWTFRRGIDEAMVVVPLGGFLISFFSLEPLGASLIAYAPIVPLAMIRDFDLIDSDVLLSSLVALVATFAQSILYLLVLDGTGYSADWGYSMIRVTIPAAFLNMAAAPLAILLWRRLERFAPRAAGGLTFAPPRRKSRLEFR